MEDEHTFDENGNLPAGIIEFTWDAFVRHFGWNEHRQRLLDGLKDALQHLAEIGCRRVYIDGSFVTAKEFPADYDACWQRDGMVLRHLDPVLLDFSPERRSQKEKYGGEWFPADAQADHVGTVFIEFFQRDRSGNPKGIVTLTLENRS